MDRRTSPREGVTLETPVELYRLLVDSVTDYAIFALDHEGRILSWNAGAERLKGWTTDEIVGRHFSVFYPPDDLAAGKPARELEVAAREGRFEDEDWRLRKDGSRFWANVVITALHSADGRLIGFAKVTRDLTARKEAEELARRLAAEAAARAEAERHGEELALANDQLQQQAIELEQQTEEAQSLAEELEQTNDELERTLHDAEGAREAARAAEHFTTGILASISDPFVVYDREWRFRYINARAAELIGRSGHGPASDLARRVVWEEYPHLVGTMFEREMRRAVAEGVALTFEAYSPERGQWSQVFCYPLPDGGLATQWKDTTERKRTEEATRYLARASEVLGASLDYETTLGDLARLVVPELADWCAVDIVSADGQMRQLAVAHVDPDKVRWAEELNRRYPPDPDAPTGVPNVIRTGKPELYREITDELLVAGARDEEQLRLSRALGLRSAICVPLVTQGVTLGALTLVSAESGRRYDDADLALATELGRRAALAVDNARRHRAEREARRAAEAANRAKSEFLAVMSHELRTPLNAIAGYAELMSMGIRGPVTPAQQVDLQRIMRSQRSLLALVNDVLNFAKLEAGRVEFATSSVAVHPLLADLEALVLPQLEAKGLHYRCAGCPFELRVRADVEKVRQILLNLLSNAIKFTESGGRITVDCEAGETMVDVRVHDTGIGIPSDKLDTIFEPFVQLHRDLTSTHEGTGLGLSISRDLARAMGGDLIAESEAGSGALFVLRLPRAS